ncbi:MAG: hypothetical protein ACOZJX_00295 [Pseudomonadota bacterium]
MRVATLHSRSSAAVRAGFRMGGWDQPIQAEVLADFGKHGNERQIAELRPWGPTGGVTVSCCSIGGHYSAQTLDRDSDPHLPTSQQAVQMLATFFFGADDLAPRIVGPVDWAMASLSLRYRDDDEHHLMRLQIKPLADGARREMASCRMEQDGAHKAFLLYLRPADADPLYALLRVGLGIDVDRGFTA